MLDDEKKQAAVRGYNAHVRSCPTCTEAHALEEIRRQGPSVLSQAACIQRLCPTGTLYILDFEVACGTVDPGMECRVRKVLMGRIEAARAEALTTASEVHDR